MVQRLDDIVHAYRDVVRETQTGALPADVGPFALTSLRFVGELIARLEDGRFHHPVFVRRLALDANTRYLDAIYDPTSRPGPWKVAMDIAARGEGKTMRNLLLGINAHVSYDLVITLSKYLSTPLRPSEREDFTTLNTIIRTAVDGVQSFVEQREERMLMAADFAIGRLDELATWSTFKWARARAFDNAVRVMKGDVSYAHIERQATAAAHLISVLPI
jgi:hypothetical protein